MKMLKRSLATAVIAVASVALATGAAYAAITPNPYNTTNGTGGFTTDSPLGRSTCTVTLILANGVGTATGGNFTVNGATVSCSGVIVSAIVLRGGTIVVSNGVVTTRVGVLITSIFGRCLYTANLSGSQTSSNTISAAGGAGTAVVLSGICSSNPTSTLNVRLPGVVITP